MGRPTRREFLRNSFTAACATGITCSLSAAGLTAATVHVPTAVASPLPAEPLPIKKGILLDMLPSKLSYPDRFKMARDVGFEVVQAPTTPDEREAEEIKKGADGANVRIDSVMNMDHWKYPLSSSARGSGKEPGGYAHVSAQRQALGIRRRAARSCRGESADLVSRGVEPLPEGDSQAAAS